MTRVVLAFGLILCLSCISWPMAAQDERSDITVLRAAIDGDGPFVRGQRVDLLVEALTSASLDRAPRPPTPEGQGLVVLGPTDRPTPVSDRVDGRTVNGFRWRFLVFPVRSGDLVIEPLTVDIAGEMTQTGPLPVPISVPDDLSGLPGFAVATDLSIDQNLSPQGLSVGVGDAVTREVTVTAEDTVAMMLPALEPAQVSGLRAYANAPMVADRSSRGRVAATRIDRIVYVIEQPGTYTLPPVEVVWWDTGADQVRVAIAEAVTFEAAGGVAAEGEHGLEEEPAAAAEVRVLLMIAAGVALPAVAAAYLTASSRRLRSRRLRRRRDLALRNALSDGDPRMAVAGIYRYLGATTGFTSLAAWLEPCSDTALRQQVKNLFADAYGGQRASWSGDAICRGLLRWQREAPSPAPDTNAETAWQLNPVASVRGHSATWHFTAKRQTLPDGVS